MAVKQVVTSAPSTKALTPVSTIQSTPTFAATPQAHVFNPPMNLPNATTIMQGPATMYCYLRNNRIVGYFSDLQLLKDSIAFHISRENEFGADI